MFQIRSRKDAEAFVNKINRLAEKRDDIGESNCYDFKLEDHSASDSGSCVISVGVSNGEWECIKLWIPGEYFTKINDPVAWVYSHRRGVNTMIRDRVALEKEILKENPEWDGASGF